MKTDKTIDYVITGVWFTHKQKGAEYISHVLLHENLGNEIKCPGEKRTVQDVIQLLRTKKIYTCKWIYEDGGWMVGDPITAINNNGNIVLSTSPVADKSDSIINLINMDCVIEHVPVSYLADVIMPI